MSNSQKVSIIIPAFNEEKIISHVVSESLKLRDVDEVIVINDGSTDKTEQMVEKYLNHPKFIYLKHKNNKGKGEAMKTGLHRSKNEIIQFLDADLMNITSSKISKMFRPVILDKVDVSRGAFSVRTRRVTDFAVKPMLKILFPSVDFKDPITGQICAKKSFLKNIDFEERYGVDIAILFDAMAMGQRIQEVDIGKLKTKDSDVETIKEMAKQVLETMIKKAGLIHHKYNLVLFAMDNTIVSKEGFTWFFRKLKIESEIRKHNILLNDGKITQKEYFEKTALLFRGMKESDVSEIAKQIPLVRYAKEVINALIRRKYKVALISANFSPMVLPIAKTLGIDLVRCVYLEQKNKVYTGKISQMSQKIWFADDYESAIKQAYSATIRKAQVKPSETVIVAHNEKYLSLFYKAGLGIAYRPSSPELRELADKVISLQAEILAIIE